MFVFDIPICSMYGIFTDMYHKNQLNVGIWDVYCEFRENEWSKKHGNTLTVSHLNVFLFGNFEVDITFRS